MTPQIRTGLYSKIACTCLKAFSDNTVIENSSLDEIDDINNYSIVVQDDSNEVVFVPFKHISNDNFIEAIEESGMSQTEILKEFGKKMLQFASIQCRKFKRPLSGCLDEKLVLNVFDDDRCEPGEELEVKIKARDFVCTANLLAGNSMPKGISKKLVEKVKGIPLDPVCYESLRTLREEIARLKSKLDDDFAAEEKAHEERKRQIIADNEAEVEKLEKMIEDIRSAKKNFCAA